MPSSDSLGALVAAIGPPALYGASCYRLPT
jgi:hypothetical protein